MSKRAGSHRTVLSPKLLVDFALNDGVFYHNGKRYIDTDHQSRNARITNRALGFGLSSIAKYVAKPLAQVAGTPWQEREFYALTSEYEFRPSEIVGRLEM